MIAEVNTANAIPGLNVEPDTLILCRFFRDGDHATTPFKNPDFLTGV